MNDVDLFDVNCKENLGSYLFERGGKSHWLEILQETISDEQCCWVGKVLVLRDITETLNTQKKLEDANVQLEKRVTERTENLQETNQQLSVAFKSLAKAQQQLVQSEKMAALGSLVAGISHEVNTPIGISVTSATNIEEKLIALEKSFNSGELTKSDFEFFVSHSRKGLDILVGNLKRASDLIKSFKQVAVDQSSDDFRDVGLHEYSDSIVLSLQPKFKNKDITIVNNIPEDIFVYTNPGAIYQILSNLIVNSLIHAFDEHILKPTICLDGSMDNLNFTIMYKDNGHGVDSETKARIFEPFFTTKRGQGGSGLGMNVVYNLITSSLQGQVDIASSPGEGLSLTMIFPLKKEGKLT